jgi:APA family basic amino acid/polyamine antiporter
VLIVLFAMQGFEVVPLPAGSVRSSARTVPFATLGAIAAAATLYVLLHAACVQALPDLAKSTAPLADAAATYGGRGAAWLIGLTMQLSALGVAFAMLAMSPRYLSVLGKRDALGEWIGQEDVRSVPQRALFLTSTTVLGLVLVGRLGELFVLSSVLVLAQYAMSVAALARLAIAQRHGLLRRHLVPAPLALGAIFTLALAARTAELLVAAAALASGGVVFWIRQRNLRERDTP